MIVHGDAIEAMNDIPNDTIDAILCDPPCGIAWMNRDWDCFRRRHNPNDVGRDNVFGRTSATSPHSYGESERGNFIAWLTEIMREALRVTKPGGHGLVWGLPRTSHWTTMALEDAGWEVREIIHAIHNQGFPKSRDIGRDFDHAAGIEPRIIGERPWSNQDIRGNAFASNPDRERFKVPITEPVTEEAKRWEGFGTATKPAVEHWILVRKPLSEKNVMENVRRWNTGALNLKACEVGRHPDDQPGWHKTGSYGRTEGYLGEDTFKIRDMPPKEVQARRGSRGRWAPNLVLEHHPLCVRVGTTKVRGCPQTVVQGGKDGGGYDVGSSDGTRHDVFQGYGDAEGLEEVTLYACVPGCPVRELDRQGRKSTSRKGKPRKSKEPGEGWGMTHTGQEYNDQGGPSRFFPQFQSDPSDEIDFVTWRSQPKPSRSEKEAGLDELEVATLNRVNPGGLEAEPRFAPVKVKNNHPTCKSIELLRWLAKLITPPDGLLLDCFLGSGSVGCAAALEGFRFIGIEQGEPIGDDRYIRIAKARLEYWKAEVDKQRE